jgi:hypothetical protein
MAERYVGIVKDVLSKAKQGGVDPQMALLCLRSTPIDNRTPSPAELLYGRKIRSNLPVQQELRLHRINEHESLMSKQKIAEEYYNNRGTGPELSELSPGDKVFVQDPNNKKWSPGMVKSKSPEPRSYVIALPSGTVARRNRRFLRERSECEPSQNSETVQNASEIPNTEEAQSSGKVKKKVTFENAPTEQTMGSNSEPRRSARVPQKPNRLIEEC